MTTRGATLVQPGDLVADRYEVRRLVGRGGMGEVHEAHDRVLDRSVALKVLGSDLVDDESSISRITTEAKLAAKVRHPNVVQVLDAIVHERRAPVIVLEFVEGPTLAAVLRERGPLPVDEALDIVGEVAAGLAAAHDADLVHRDVSPTNVLLDEGHGSRARLTDFGIARSTTQSTTLTGTIRGSVGYVAPEQADGGEVGPHTDVYALACVAYTALAGRPPYEAEEPLGVVWQHVSAPRPDVRDHRPEVPFEIAVAIQAAMAKDPARRIPNAAAFAAAIGRPLRQDGTSVVFLPEAAIDGPVAGPGPAPAGTTGDEPPATAAFAALGIDDPGRGASGPIDVAAEASDVAAGVVSASPGTEDSGPILVIGTDTGPTAAPTAAPALAGVGLEQARARPMWMVGALAVVVAVGIAVGQSVSPSGKESTEADGLAVGVAGTVEAGELTAVDRVEDAALSLRIAVAQLQVDDEIAPARASSIDEHVDAVVIAAQAGDEAAVEAGLATLRDDIRAGLEAGDLDGEGEIALLERLVAIEDALTAVQLQAVSNAPG